MPESVVIFGLKLYVRASSDLLLCLVCTSREYVDIGFPGLIRRHLLEELTAPRKTADEGAAYKQEYSRLFNCYGQQLRLCMTQRTQLTTA
ncbi:hypothetical protein QFZ96_005789 [Paraburkholderia youngii]